MLHVGDMKPSRISSSKRQITSIVLQQSRTMEKCLTTEIVSFRFDRHNAANPLNSFEAVVPRPASLQLLSKT
jgi:hypothetical protein